MSIRQLSWRAIYELLAARVRPPEWAFMNYGYASLSHDTAPLTLEPGDESDRLCIQLYEHALGGADLRHRDVVEVGCGRGGGSSYLHRYRHPRSTTGLDFSYQSIALCTRTRAALGLTFVRGDAQKMPFPDGSFDAVISVESSHCYDSVPAFLAEAFRVLRPGGHVFFADFRSPAGAEQLQREWDACGLTLRRQDDITDNVLTALRLDSGRKLALLDAWVPRAAHRPLRRFAAVEGTRMFRGFETGAVRYLSAQLAKN